MPAPTLVLPPRFSDDSNALWRAAIALDWPILRLQGWRVPEEFAAQNVAIYGEPMWAHFVAEQLGVALFEPSENYLASLPAPFVGRKIEFLSLGEARQKSFPLFVKPAGEKAFEARVYENASEISEIWEDDLAVLISEPVRFEVEYRCFVLGEGVQTLSSYWRGEVSTRGENGVYQNPPEEQKQALSFAEHILQSGFSPAPAGRGVVLDVGKIANDSWAVIEANPAFGAGIYGCDPVQVLEIVAACICRDDERAQ